MSTQGLVIHSFSFKPSELTQKSVSEKIPYSTFQTFHGKLVLILQILM